MPRNNRDRRDPNRRVVHVTNRCWKGLPFVPVWTINRTLKGVLARAQTLYPVEIVCYLFMGNHYHMVLAGDANRLSLFMNYLDGEIAKRMMRLFPNRWGPKFWSGRFKEQHLPTVDSVLNKIEYLFCNPLRARLVSRLASYPGISSFQDFSSLGNKSGTLCSFTFPRFFKRIKERVLSRKRDIEIATELQKNSEGLLELKTNLFGWVHCFKEKRERKVVLEQLCRRIAQAEKEAKAKGAIEAKRLITQPFDKPYYPEKKKRDRTPFVDCPDEELRKVFIAKYQEFRAECRSAWEKVKSGLTALCPTLWPRGAFIPGGLFSPLAEPRPG